MDKTTESIVREYFEKNAWRIYDIVAKFEKEYPKEFRRWMLMRYFSENKN